LETTLYDWVVATCTGIMIGSGLIGLVVHPLNSQVHLTFMLVIWTLYPCLVAIWILTVRQRMSDAQGSNRSIRE